MTDEQPKSEMIQLDLSDDDEVIIPLKRRPLPAQPPAQPKTFNVHQEAGAQAEVPTTSYLDTINSLNDKYTDYNMLMPYSTALVLEDLDKRKLFAMQIAAKGINTEAPSYVLICGAGRLESDGTVFKAEGEEFGVDSVSCISKFKRLFKEKTMNDWEDRGGLLEIPGYYSLYSDISFGLHGINAPSTADDKRTLLNALAFLKLKSKHLQRNSNVIAIGQFVDYALIAKLLASLGCADELYSALTSRKIAQMWRIVDLAARELTKLTPNTKTLVDFAAELG